MRYVLAVLVSSLDGIIRRLKDFEIRICIDVIPAKAGIQARRFKDSWMPVFTGMTANLGSSILALLFSFGILSTAFAADKEVIPVPANTQEVAEETRSIAGSQLYFSQYESSLRIDQIRNFYRKVLADAGWTEKDYLGALTQGGGLKMDSAAVNSMKENLNFEKDGALLTLDFAAERTGGKTAYTIMQGKLEVSGKSAEELDFTPRLLATPRHDVAPVYPEAALISLSEGGNFMQAAYSSKADMDAVAEFYRRKMPSYGWDLVEDRPVKDVQTAASQADIEKYCPECAEQGIALPSMDMFMKELIFTNTRKDRCRIGLFQVDVPKQDQVPAMNFTNIMVDYEKK